MKKINILFGLLTFIQMIIFLVLISIFVKFKEKELAMPTHSFLDETLQKNSNYVKYGYE